METKNERFVSLDMLRGLAAIGVVFFHAFIKYDAVAPLFVLVDFFFVLSGFVLEPLYPKLPNDRTAIKKFIHKRALRFYPMSIASLLAALLWMTFVENHEHESFIKGIGSFFIACLLLQMLSSHALIYNNPLWSLSAEWITNLFAIPLITRNKNRLLILGILFGYLLLIFSYVHNSESFTFLTLGKSFGGLGRAIIGFLIGVLIRRHFHQLRNSRLLVSKTVVALSVIAIYFSMYFTLHHNWIAIYWIPPLFGFVVIYFAHHNSAVTQSWLNKPAIILGNLSFGIYVWQDLMRKITVSLLLNLGIQGNEDLLHFIQFVITLAFSVAVTLMVQKFVEKPLQTRFAPKRMSSAESA